MFQGTGSDVGKTVLVAALCRAAANRGLIVAPFKPQNMSNNAAVVRDPITGGEGEIGRAQWLQAVAARQVPTVHMNPVLLKPHSDTGAQIILRGQVWGSAEAADYQQGKAEFMSAILDSYDELCRDADLIVIEGAGSPAEVNLRERDIANMGFARAARVPVILIGDIDRGGVIASLVGTHAVLEPDDRALVHGFVINKFRGDPQLFDSGLCTIVDRTGWRSFGVLPWLAEARMLPAEDAVVLDHADVSWAGKVKIAAPMLSRIANFDDLDPLKAADGVTIEFIPPGPALPGDADVVILLGTKATLRDLQTLSENGWDIDVTAHARRGGHVVGLCGGYQMLGREVTDNHGADGQTGRAFGLGLLDVTTVMHQEKTVRTVSAVTADGQTPISGYEIHLGQTDGPDCARPMVLIDGAPDGACDPTGRIRGCYLHGLFAGDAFRRRFLREVGGEPTQGLAYTEEIERHLDSIAAQIEHHLDVDGLLATASSNPLL